MHTSGIAREIRPGTERLPGFFMAADELMENTGSWQG